MEHPLRSVDKTFSVSFVGTNFIPSYEYTRLAFRLFPIVAATSTPGPSFTIDSSDFLQAAAYAAFGLPLICDTSITSSGARSPFFLDT